MCLNNLHARICGTELQLARKTEGMQNHSGTNCGMSFKQGSGK